MNARYERRSKEAPMEFEWTNKDRDVIPIDSPFRSAVKRSHTDMAVSTPPFPQPNPSTPTFGANRDVPFIFHQPTPNSAPTHPWIPPPQKLSPQVNDVTMRDASPPKPEETTGSPNMRAMATGAMSRVFRARQKRKERPERRRRIDPDEDEYGGSDEGEHSEDDRLGELTSTPRRRTALHKAYSEPITTTANHNHHYTLHMPTPQMSHSEVPYVLLGYLQFVFNLSLVLGFLYLAFHFILAVQKDVEQKMTEHAFDSLQEIAACKRLYEDNFCADKPSPIIVRQCDEWKTCMGRDPSIVGRTRLLAELIGEVINGFMEPITWRTLIFTLSSLSMGVVFVNTLLTFYRTRHAPVNTQLEPPPTPAPAFPMYGVPPYWGQPSTPHLNRDSSASYMSHHAHPESQMRRTWSVPVEGDDTTETPSRRRRITEDDAVNIR